MSKSCLLVPYWKDPIACSLGWGQKGRTRDEKVNGERRHQTTNTRNATRLEPAQDQGARCFPSPHSPSHLIEIPNYRTEGRAPECHSPCHQAAKRAVHSIKGCMYRQSHSGKCQWLLLPGEESVLLPLNWAVIRNDLKSKAVVLTERQEDQLWREVEKANPRH